MKVKNKLTAIPKPCVDCDTDGGIDMPKPTEPAKASSDKLALLGRSHRLFVATTGTIGFQINLGDGRQVFAPMGQISQELAEAIEADGKDAAVCKIMMEFMDDIDTACKKYGTTMYAKVNLPKQNAK